MALSEEKKQQRKEIILATAEALIRKNGTATFSMRELAKAAGVSFATPFNLFGSKADLLNALMDQSILEVGETKTQSGDAIENIFKGSRQLIKNYTKDADYFRTLFISVSISKQSLNTAIQIWHDALNPLFNSKVMDNSVNQRQLAEHLEMVFVGSLMLWMTGHLDNKGWLHHYEYGIATGLLGGVKSRRIREQLVGIRDKAQAKMKKV